MEGFSILSGLALPLAVLAAAALWAVAMSEIGVELRKGLFSRTQLAATAAVISAVAVFVIVAAGVLFPGDDERETRASGCEFVRGSVVFSFGLDRPFAVGEGCEREGGGP